MAVHLHTGSDPRTAIGTVYGVLLNDCATVARMATQFDAPPYGAPPKAPVLYIKPRNTFGTDGAVVRVPAEPGRIRVDATVGAVIGRTATRVRAADALSFVDGYRIVADVTLPHDSFYRPAVRQRCRDGFCPMSEVRRDAAFDPSSADVVVSIGANVVHRRSLGDVVRDLPTLIADITAFMTLDAGDVVLLGAPDGAPCAQAGDRVRIDVTGLGSLSFSVDREGGTR
jgi:5-oxopent-3-ene-1,2,5-tricarboxylate decarboxylase/2-hydroxyhepta-2,4-diene-1,7-dioate isomerase